MCFALLAPPLLPPQKRKKEKKKCLGGFFPGGSVVKNLLANAGDAGEMGLIPEKIP